MRLNGQNAGKVFTQNEQPIYKTKLLTPLLKLPILVLPPHDLEV
jgi:hypothetical protein